MFALLTLFASVFAQECPCDTCYDLNTASSWELQQTAYLSFVTSMNVVINYQPNICSKNDLLEVDGIDEERISTWDCFYATCEGQTEGNWVVGDWSECSKSCDNGDTSTGKRTRTVECVGEGDNVVCNESAKPAEKEICNTGCITAEWKFSDWGVCKEGDSGDCVMTRRVQCIDSDGFMATACEDSEMPSTTQACECPDLSSLLSMDMLKDFNMKQSNTDYYVDVPGDTIIIRRAEEFHLWIANQYGESSASPLSEIETNILLCNDPVFNPDQKYEVDFTKYLKWKACKDCRNAGSGWLIFDFPADAPVGKYEVSISMYGHDFTPFNMVVLFNPFSRFTREYMEDIIEAREYVQENVGLIWQGSTGDNAARLWLFDSHVYDNLEVSLLALKRATSLEERGSLIYASRSISYAVGQDMCYGRWEEPYTEGEIGGGYNCDTTLDPESPEGAEGEDVISECKEPWYWSGTSQLFAVYRRQNSGVQFCQCWVFAGVTNTVARSLGIPSRIVTNFDSAHDTEENRAIEKFYRGPDEGGAYYTEDEEWGTSSDSVWNFHVWNEMYFTRDDIDVSQDAEKLLVSEGCTEDGGEWSGMWDFAGEFNGRGSWTRTFLSDGEDASAKFIGYNTESGEWVVDADVEHDFSAVYAYFEDSSDSYRPPSGSYRTWCMGQWQWRTWSFSVPDASGWQAVDATPQEPSNGYGNPYAGEYVLGPASIKQMKENRDLNYDNQFVIGEVNSNIHFWTRPGNAEEDSGEGAWTLESITEHELWVSSTDDMGWLFSMGREMSVKKPGIIHPNCINGNTEYCDLHRMIVTNDYKYKEPSGPGMPTDTSKQVEVGQEWSSIGRRLQAVEEEFVEVAWIRERGARVLADRTPETIERYGGDHSNANVAYRLASFENVDAEVYISFSPRVSGYTGRGSRGLHSTIEQRTLHPGEEILVEYSAPLSLYEDFITNSNMDVHTIEIESFISVKINGELLPGIQRYHRARFLVCIPQTYLRNSVQCRRDYIWMKPTGDLTYECARAPDQLSVGDGICDAENNIFGCFDGGDCCTSTCGDSKNCGEPKDECHDPRAPDFALFECPFPELFADRANRITSKCKSAKWDCENPSETCLGQLDALEEYGEMSVCLSKAFHRLSERTREVFRQKAQCCPMRRAKCDMLNDVGAIFDMREDSSHSLPCAISATRETIMQKAKAHESLALYGIHTLQSANIANSLRGLGKKIVDLGAWADIAHCHCDAREDKQVQVDNSVFCSYPSLTIPGAQGKVLQTTSCQNTYGVHGGQQCTVTSAEQKEEVWECVDDKQTSWGGVWQLQQQKP